MSISAFLDRTKNTLLTPITHARLLFHLALSFLVVYFVSMVLQYCLGYVLAMAGLLFIVKLGIWPLVAYCVVSGLLIMFLLFFTNFLTLYFSAVAVTEMHKGREHVVSLSFLIGRVIGDFSKFINAFEYSIVFSLVNTVIFLAIVFMWILLLSFIFLHAVFGSSSISSYSLLDIVHTLVSHPIQILLWYIMLFLGFIILSIIYGLFIHPLIYLPNLIGVMGIVLKDWYFADAFGNSFYLFRRVIKSTYVFYIIVIVVVCILWFLLYLPAIPILFVFNLLGQILKILFVMFAPLYYLGALSLFVFRMFLISCISAIVAAYGGLCFFDYIAAYVLPLLKNEV